MKQVIITARDWTKFDGKQLPEDTIFEGDESSYVNLAITNRDTSPSAKGLVGIVRLKRKNPKPNDEHILIVEPRFENLSPMKMLEALSYDEEFDLYESKLSSFYHFFVDEKPIKLNRPIDFEVSTMNALLFLNILKNIVKKPLYGRMVRIEANMVSKVKGKIVMHKQIKHNLLHARPDRMYCAYQQFTYDVPENQYLKAMLLKVKRYVEELEKPLPVMTELVRVCWNGMSHISLPDKKIERTQLPKLRGLYSYYNEALDIAKMIDDEISIGFNGEVHETGYVVPFAINMQNLFELYTRYRLRKTLKNVNEHLMLKPFDNVKAVLEKSVDEPELYIHGNVKPDIIIFDKRNEQKTIAVFDAKYKDFKSSTTRFYVREDRLQILAYGFMYNPLHIGHIFPSKHSSHHLKQRVTGSNTIYHELTLGGEQDAYDIELAFLNEQQYDAKVVDTK